MEKQYPFRMGWQGGLLDLFLIGCTWLFASLALEHRLIRYHGLTFSPWLSGLILWGIALLFGFGAIAFGLMVAKSLIAPRRIVLGFHELRLPKSNFSSESLTIPYEAIEEVFIERYHGKDMSLVILHEGGKQTVGILWLPSHEAFRDLHRTLSARVLAARG